MKAVEFTTELTGAEVIHIPTEIASRLPRGGKARILVLTADSTEDQEWREASYQQFLRDDPSEDSVYDSLR